ncbi:MAG: hypothetical protein AB9869_00325 [Verrucomicrobiia bacterium]
MNHPTSLKPVGKDENARTISVDISVTGELKIQLEGRVLRVVLIDIQPFPKMQNRLPQIVNRRVIKADGAVKEARALPEAGSRAHDTRAADYHGPVILIVSIQIVARFGQMPVLFRQAFD